MFAGEWVDVLCKPSLYEKKCRLLEFLPSMLSVKASANLMFCAIQYNLNGSNPDGSFTVDDSNSFFSPYKVSFQKLKKTNI